MAEINSMTIQFNVNNQTLTKTSTEKIVEHSVNYLYAQFTFNSNWDNVDKKYLIVQNEELGTNRVLLDNENKALIPSIYVIFSRMVVALIGVDENDSVVITTNPVYIPIYKTLVPYGEDPFLKYVVSTDGTINVNQSGDRADLSIPDIYGTSLGTNDIDVVILKNRALQEISRVKLNFINDTEHNTSQTYSSSKIESELSDRDTAIQANATNIQNNLDRLISDEADIHQNALDIVGLKATDRSHDSLLAGLRQDLTAETTARQNQDTALNNSILSKLNRLEFGMDSTYKITLKAYDSNDNLLYNETIDLPNESAIVNIAFDSATNELIFTLQNGNQTRVPLGSIITGLASQTYVDGLNAQRIARENAIEGALNDEITARGNADTALGGRIDSANGEIALRVKYEDIVDDLTSTNINKPLSANQGRVLKGLIDALNDAETGIQANEAVRQQNESTRISNEQARVQAENDRATEFASWSSIINGKQNALTTDSTINLVNDEISVNTNVIATKSYAESLFATSEEIDTMLEEVFG